MILKLRSSWNTGAWTETPVRSPPWRYPHGPPPGGDPGEEPDSGPLFPVFPGNRLRCRSRARLPTGYRKHCPCPGRGRGRRPKAGRGGGAGEELLGDILSGEGETSSPAPLPQWQYPPRSSVPGQAWKNRVLANSRTSSALSGNQRQHHLLARLLTRYRHAQSPLLPEAGAEWWGLPESGVMSIPYREAGRGAPRVPGRTIPFLPPGTGRMPALSQKPGAAGSTLL